jgi:hypothetical protein
MGIEHRLPRIKVETGPNRGGNPRSRRPRNRDQPRRRERYRQNTSPEGVKKLDADRGSNLEAV